MQVCPANTELWVTADLGFASNGLFHLGVGITC